MALTLDLDTLLDNITTIAATITGIRKAYSYDAWPDAPPGMFDAEAALHLTGLPGTDGTEVRYIVRGSDLSEYEIEVPLYTVVCSGAQIKRSARWIAPYFGRYPETFRVNLHLSGAITAGRFNLTQGSRIVRTIPNFPAYDDFFTLRHSGVIHTKGAVTNTV